jgi:ketosteroid isomerase-like protein
MAQTNALDMVFDHLASGDVAAALGWLTPDAHIWHCFDRVAHDREATAREWSSFVDSFTERTFTDVRTQDTATGSVRQHVMTVRTAAGNTLAWDVCVIVTLVDGRIQRLDEYLDRAASFAPAA